jgi:hypothetical protein
MSARPPKTDNSGRNWNVRYGPIADMATSLSDLRSETFGEI